MSTLIKQIKLILYALPLVIAGACDVVEEGLLEEGGGGFVVGTEPKETEFLYVDQAQLTFSPEGGTQEIKVTSIASWEVTLTNNNAGQFSVSPSEGKGNGIISVTAKENTDANISYNAEMQVRPLNFEMEPITIVLRQKTTTFEIEKYPSSDITPEEGGSVTMTAYSTINWKLEVVPHDSEGSVGDINWITVTPGLEGEGKDANIPQEFRFTWSPNYTNAERTIMLRLMPSSDLNVDNLRPITLVQAGGTYPQSVRCIVNKQDIVNAEVSLEYSSRSPVKDCGIYVYKMSNIGDDELVSIYRPSVAGGEFSKNGLYTVNITDLAEDTKFRLIPFSINEVGEMTGDPREITTGIKPENMMYDGVAIVNGNDGVTVETSSNHESLKSTAKFSVVVTSDVEPLQNRIASAVLNVNGKNVPGAATSIDAGSWLYVFNVSDLVPNSTYDYSITITSADLPRSQGQMRAKTAVASGKFKTPGLTPGDTDNDKPTSGE